MDVTTMPLRHYAAEPLHLDWDRAYQQAADQLKPRGIWVSVLGDDDWPSWCRGEGWGIDELAIEHAVTLSTDAKILLIDTCEGVKGLTARFPATRQPWHYETLPDWQEIAAEYDGIIIAPYQWHARISPGTHWYYGWDCASGCIWNLEAIADFAPLPERASC